MFDIINGIESERSIRVSVKRKWPQHRYAIDLQTLGILSCTSQFVQEFIVRVCDLQYLVAHRRKMNQWEEFTMMQVSLVGGELSSLT